MSNAPYQVMPPLAADEFEALKADIELRGVQVPVEYDEAGNILDGHHRVEACTQLGLTNWPRLIRHGLSEQEKRRHARRLNLDRRHLNQEMRRSLIAEDLRENPASSDRAIGAGLGVDHKTVAAVREGMVSTGEIPQLNERQGRDKRVRRVVQFVPSTPEEEKGLKLSAKALNWRTEAAGREHRRNLAAELSAQTIDLPTGRKYPCWYVDLPWRRKGGITNRSYENHYPTMDWPEILEFLKRAQDLLLPDAWGFFWIPRAHLLALVEIELEAPHAETGELVPVRIKAPLAWAIMLAAGFDSYSTCYVWTKTDEAHPDESGSGLIAYDQDELLLLFKRGRGLPKPETSQKYGSNHRERARLLGHSRKPEHFRRMIVDMVGADLNGEPLPVMEFFARVDADNPLPRNWSAWGNQSAPQGAAAEGDASAARSIVAEASSELPRDRVVGVAGDYVLLEPPAVVPRDFLTPGEAEALAEFESLPIAAEGSATPSTAAAAPAEGGAAAISSVPAAESAPLFVDLPEARAPLQVGEYEALKALSDFCYPRRAAIVEAVGAEYQAKGLAFQQAASGQWILREAGHARLRELEAERPSVPKAAPAESDLDIPEFLRRPPTARPQQELDLAPPVAGRPRADVQAPVVQKPAARRAKVDPVPPEIVDGKLQTRIPLTEDELELHRALRTIADGGDPDGVHWSIKRDLVGAGFLHVPATPGKPMRVTEEGEAFLAQLVGEVEGAAA